MDDSKESLTGVSTELDDLASVGAQGISYIKEHMTMMIHVHDTVTNRSTLVLSAIISPTQSFLFAEVLHPDDLKNGRYIPYKPDGTLDHTGFMTSELKANGLQ